MKPRTILGVGWLVFLVYAWPGFLMTDGADQLIDARTGAFTDWHPTMMTELWRIAERLFAGPAPMLVLQSGLLLGGAYFLLRRTLTDRAAAIAAICILLFPPILATEAVVTDDAQLASFLVAAAAALLSQDARARRAGLVLAFIACGMRPTAAVAALPVLLVCIPRVPRALVTWAIVAALSLGASHLLVDAHTGRTEVAASVADWHKAGDAPGAFLAHRWHRMWSHGKHFDAVYTKAVPAFPRDAATLGHMEAHSLVQRLLTAPVRLLARTPLFRPLVYFVVALVLLGLAIRRRERIAIGLVASGLAFQLSQLAVGLRGQFRDAHWLIVATAFAFVLLLVTSASRRLLPG